MPSPDVLATEIRYMKNDINEIKEDLKEIKNMFNKLDDRYPTRREFNAIKRILWIAISAISLVTAFLQFK